MTCQYPEHSGQKKGVQGRDTINLQMAQDIYKLFGVIVPVESGSFAIIICSCVYSICLLCSTTYILKT